MAETNGLLNRRRGYTLPRVRISLSPPIFLFLMFFVYVLYSPSLNKRYVGSTSNLDKRISEHNSGKSKFTKSGMPWSPVHFESFPSLSLNSCSELILESRVGKKCLVCLLYQPFANS